MTDSVLLNENPELYFRQKRQKALEEVPTLIEMGHSLIYPELHEDWDKMVKSSVSVLYYGDDVKGALQIMEALSMSDSVDKAKQIYNDLDKGAGFRALTLNIVKNFDRRGPEFWLAVNPGEISIEDLKSLVSIQSRNLAIESNANSKQTPNHI